jgi:hypothetical protein
MVNSLLNDFGSLMLACVEAAVSSSELSLGAEQCKQRL